MKRKNVLTLRVPMELYEETKKIAKRKGKSFNRYVCELLEKNLKEEKRKALFDAFSLIAEDVEEVDVNYAFEAQREVVLKNE